MPVLLALDVGERRTGVAVGSTESGLARPHSVIRHGSSRDVARRIGQLVAETGAAQVIVGYPANPDGSESAQGERVRRFIEGMADEFGAPVLFRNEAYSSQDAQARLIDLGGSRKRRREQEDAVAAAIILQGYLDSLRGGR